MTNSAASTDAAGPDAAIAVVAGHGEWAAGLVSAVAQIAGRGDLLASLSNRGLGPGEIEAAMRAAAARAPIRMIFTDLPAGSCTIAARRFLRERPDVVLVTGANLPAVLDFVLTAGQTPAAGDGASVGDMAAHAVERGRGALQLVPPPPPAAPAPVPGTEVRGAH